MTDDPIRISPGRPRDDRPADKNPLPPPELLVLGLMSLAVLVAAAADDGLDARSAWLYVTILGAAYIISCGLSRR